MQCVAVCLIHMCDMIHLYVWHDSIICVAVCLIHMCDMIHSYMWHDSIICVTWLIYTCDMTPARDLTPSYVWHDSCMHVTWLIHTCDMTPSYMWHDLFVHVTQDSWVITHDFFIRVTWLIHTCDMTHSYMWHDTFKHRWHDSFIHVTWLIHTCDMTHPYTCLLTHESSHMMIHNDSWVNHDLWDTCLFTHLWDTCLFSDGSWVMSHIRMSIIWMSHVTRVISDDSWVKVMFHESRDTCTDESCHTFIRVTWLIHMIDIRMWDMTHDSWLIHMCDMTHLHDRHSYVRHDSWLITT